MGLLSNQKYPWMNRSYTMIKVTNVYLIPLIIYFIFNIEFSHSTKKLSTKINIKEEVPL